VKAYENQDKDLELQIYWREKPVQFAIGVGANNFGGLQRYASKRIFMDKTYIKKNFALCLIQVLPY